ncbi:MAG TPA: acyloxyacyl hydrolase [Usitatibacter sp.]|nr:acyloxyacyl hydrolase [Usitatibacter sp.]
MLALAAALLSASCLANHAENFTLQAGSGNSVDVAGIGWELPTDRCSESTRLHTGLLFRADGWRGNASGGRRIADLSVTPFARYELGRPLGVSFTAEAGIGVNLLSSTRVDDYRQFSTAFQFGEFVGVGARYGRRNEFQLGARLQHVSNGGIKRPNDGLTYGMLFLNYRF